MLNVWDDAAEIRKNQIETGCDLTFSKIFVPYFIGLVQRLKPQSIFEVGCGTGHLSLALSSFVKNIDAIEPSETMYNLAIGVLKDTTVKITKSSVQEFSSNNKYDMIISHMCVQTVRDLNEFFLSIYKLINVNSTFCFSFPHPCFYNSYKKFFKEDEYQYSKTGFKNIDLTITTQPNRPIKGIPYQHRPLNEYIKSLKRANMCLKDMDEIFPDKEVQRLYGELWKEPRYIALHASLTK